MVSADEEKAMWAGRELREECGRKIHLIFTLKRDLERMPPLDELDGDAKTDRSWLEGLVSELEAWNPERGDKKPSLLKPKKNLTGVWVDDPADSTKLRWRPAKRDEKFGWIFLDGEKQRTPLTKPANARPKVRCWVGHATAGALAPLNAVSRATSLPLAPPLNACTCEGHTTSAGTSTHLQRTTTHLQRDGKNAQLDAALETSTARVAQLEADLEATKGLALSTAGIADLAFAVAAWCLALPLRVAAWCLGLPLRVGRRLM
jgi:hypothetical protein